MAADDDDSALDTAELRMQASRRSDAGLVFTGRARPVLLPDLELTLLEEADDGASTPDRPPLSMTARLAHAAVIAILLVAAMPIVAVVFALLAR